MRLSLRTTVAAAAITFALTGLTACSSGASTSPVGVWGTPDTPGETSLEFADDGSYSGSDGCNRVLGSWESSGETITISPMATTMMACEGVEVWLVDPATVSVQGESLTVHDAAGAEIGTLTRN
jgi:heat shock protein HslJ